MSKTIIVNQSYLKAFFYSILFSEVICKQFFGFYDYYVEVCTENVSKDGTPMMVGRSIEKVRRSFYENFRIHLVNVEDNSNILQC